MALELSAELTRRYQQQTEMAQQGNGLSTQSLLTGGYDPGLMQKVGNFLPGIVGLKDIDYPYIRSVIRIEDGVAKVADNVSLDYKKGDAAGRKDAAALGQIVADRTNQLLQANGFAGQKGLTIQFDAGMASGRKNSKLGTGLFVGKGGSFASGSTYTSLESMADFGSQLDRYLKDTIGANKYGGSLTNIPQYQQNNFVPSQGAGSFDNTSVVGRMLLNAAAAVATGYGISQLATSGTAAGAGAAGTGGQALASGTQQFLGSTAASGGTGFATAGGVAGSMTPSFLGTTAGFGAGGSLGVAAGLGSVNPLQTGTSLLTNPTGVSTPNAPTSSGTPPGSGGAPVVDKSGVLSGIKSAVSKAATGGGKVGLWDKIVARAGAMLPSLLGSGIEAVIDYVVGQGLADDKEQAAALLQEESKFKPYDVTTGVGSAIFDAENQTVTGSLSPDLQTESDRYGRLLKGYGSDLENFKPEDFSDRELEIIRRLREPVESAQRNQFEDRLFNRGQLGTTGGALQQQAFSGAQGNTDLMAVLASINSGRNEQGRLFNLYGNTLSNRVNLENSVLNNISTGANIGAAASGINADAALQPFNVAQQNINDEDAFWANVAGGVGDFATSLFGTPKTSTAAQKSLIMPNNLGNVSPFINQSEKDKNFSGINVGLI